MKTTNTYRKSSWFESLIVRGKNWRVEDQSFQNDCKNKIIGFVTNSSALEQINRCKQAGICHRIHCVFN